MSTSLTVTTVLLICLQLLGGDGMPLVPLTPLQPSLDADHVELNVQYVHPAGPQPMVNADADLSVPLSATLRQVLAEAEHTGCSSGRARGVLVVCEQVSQPMDCLTTRPAAMGPPANVAMLDEDPIEDFAEEDDDPIEQVSDHGPMEEPVIPSVSAADVGASSSAAATGPAAEPASSGLLPPISALDLLPVFYAYYDTCFTFIALQIHDRLLQARASGADGTHPPHYIAANWITTLRYMCAAMQAFPVPPGSEGVFIPATVAEEDDEETHFEDATVPGEPGVLASQPFRPPMMAELAQAGWSEPVSGVTPSGRSAFSMLAMHDHLKAQHLKSWLNLLHTAGRHSDLYTATEDSELASEHRVKAISKYAPSTMSSYLRMWQQWQAFAQCHGASPYCPHAMLVADFLHVHSKASNQGLAINYLKALSWVSKHAGFPDLLAILQLPLTKAYGVASNPSPRREVVRLPMDISKLPDHRCRCSERPGNQD
eukprot:s85_g48.t1